MTTALFYQDPYLRHGAAHVVAHTGEGGVVLDQSVFFAARDGFPGDSGHIHWADQGLKIATTMKTLDHEIVLIPAEPAPLPPIGQLITQRLDWDRRHRHMRLETALHLLSVVIPLTMLGSAIDGAKARLDFEMAEEATNLALLNSYLCELIDQDLEVRDFLISNKDLQSNIDLMDAVHGPRPNTPDPLRLVQIGPDNARVDLQVCNGLHVARTGEIGLVVIETIQKIATDRHRVTIRLDV